MNEYASTYDAFFKRFFGHELNYFLKGEITAEADASYTILHRLMVYFRNFWIKNKITEAHSQLEKILIVQSSAKEN